MTKRGYLLAGFCSVLVCSPSLWALSKSGIQNAVTRDRSSMQQTRDTYFDNAGTAGSSYGNRSSYGYQEPQPDPMQNNSSYYGNSQPQQQQTNTYGGYGYGVGAGSSTSDNDDDSSSSGNIWGF